MANPSVTYSFSATTTISSSQVNQNFTDLINALTDGSKSLTIDAITCAGTATFNGAVTLGNSAGDDITVTGRVASSIVNKTTNTYDLGSSSLLWANTYSTLYFASLGAVGAPSYAFNGDTNTGIWASAADKVNISCGGVEIVEFGTTSTEVVFNDGGADIDFRIEASGVANAFFVEGSSGNVVIGASPNAWSSPSLGIGSYGGLYSETQFFSLSENEYYDGTWRFTNSSQNSCRYEMSSGAHTFKVSNGSGSAGGASGGDTALVISNSGNVGIGVSPSYKLDVLTSSGTNGVQVTTNATSSDTVMAFVNGTPATIFQIIADGSVYLPLIGSGAGTYAVKWAAGGVITKDTSSERYKDNIRDSIYGLSTVLNLQSRMFEYKNGGRTDVGLIAEEVVEYIPELVPLDQEGRPDAVNYDRIVSVCVKAIQEQHSLFMEQQVKLESLESENEALKSQMADVLSRLGRVEKKVA